MSKGQDEPSAAIKSCIGQVAEQSKMSYEGQDSGKLENEDGPSDGNECQYTLMDSYESGGTTLFLNSLCLILELLLNRF